VLGLLDAVLRDLSDGRDGLQAGSEEGRACWGGFRQMLWDAVPGPLLSVQISVHRAACKLVCR
jgi:hypothetical protein